MKAKHEKKRAKSTRAIRELRKIIGLNQTDFAAMVGASKDAVASWDIGRNPVSATMARRIALATGVDAEDLQRGRSQLRAKLDLGGRVPFTAETFARHRSSYWGRSDAGAARQHWRNCADALGLVFLAAAQPRAGRSACQLPGVVDSFIQWCEQTRADFQLEKPIDNLLEERKAKLELRHTYGQWRQRQKEEPDICRIMGFKDDPKKGDRETLVLSTDTVPLWRPGHPMRGKVAGGGGHEH